VYAALFCYLDIVRCELHFHPPSSILDGYTTCTFRHYTLPRTSGAKKKSTWHTLARPLFSVLPSPFISSSNMFNISSCFAKGVVSPIFCTPFSHCIHMPALRTHDTTLPNTFVGAVRGKLPPPLRWALNGAYCYLSGGHTTRCTACMRAPAFPYHPPTSRPPPSHTPPPLHA